MIRKYLFYFSGQLGLMLHMRFFFQWIIDFAGGGVEGLAIVSTATLGFVLFLFRFFDAITDPLSGMLSDYIVARGGKRTTILLWIAPVLPLGLLLCFSISTSFPDLLNWILLTTGLFLFFTAYTLYCIPYWSLIDDYGGEGSLVKKRLSSLLGQGLFVATAIGFVITPILIEYFGYFTTAAIVAAISFPLLILPVFSGFKVREHVEDNEANFRFSFMTVAASLLLPLKERKFLSVLLYFTGSQMAFTVLTAAAPLYVVYMLGESRSYVSVMMGPVIILAILTFMILPRCMKKYHWRTLLHASSVLLGVVFIFSTILHTPFLIPVKHQAILLFAMVGPLIAVILGVEAYAIIESGSRESRTGMYFGAFNFVIKGMNGVALWSTGVASEFVARSGETLWLRLLLGGAGALVILLSFAGHFLYRSKMKESGI
jgi:glycoside/pentoside/hexuronide:cation symporter, GPH family